MSTASLVGRLSLCALALAACSKGSDAAPRNTRTSAAAGNVAPGATAAEQSDSLVARADSARIAGDPAAKVWMVVVSDFECPYCKVWHDTVDPDLRKEFVQTGKIRVAYVNFPLRQHINAVPAAEAAMCAGAQGKFWPMHDEIFKGQEQWQPLPDPTSYFVAAAGRLGLDTAALQACMTSHRMRPIIQADHDRASAAGVNSTPSFIVGNVILGGVQPIETLRQVLDSALAAAGQPK